MDNKEVRYLYLDDIIHNRFQPRENFDEKALKELIKMIKNKPYNRGNIKMALRIIKY